MNNFCTSLNTNDEVKYMPLIPCNLDCIYHGDGYCQLGTAAIVSNTSDSGCIHRIKKNAAEISSTAGNNDYRSIIQEHQSLL